jgi:hypothetical protein
LMTTLSSPTQHGVEVTIRTQLVVRRTTAPARIGPGSDKNIKR